MQFTVALLNLSELNCWYCFSEYVEHKRGTECLLNSASSLQQICTQRKFPFVACWLVVLLKCRLAD